MPVIYLSFRSLTNNPCDSKFFEVVMERTLRPYKPGLVILIKSWLCKQHILTLVPTARGLTSCIWSLTDLMQCSQMTFSKIRTNTAGKIRTDWKNYVLFFDMGIKLKDFASTIEIRRAFLNLTISNYFTNINHIFKCNSIPYTHTVI